MNTKFASVADFIETEHGRLFCLLRTPAPAPGQKVVLVIPPFAEEMNKSRRMFTLLADALGQQDIALCVFDLFGTGDSSGDFADATLDI